MRLHEMSPKQVKQLASHRLQHASEKWLYIQSEFARFRDMPDVKTTTSLIEHSMNANKRYLTESEANQAQARAVIEYQRRASLRKFMRRGEQ